MKTPRTGKKIRFYRKKEGLTQAELAEKAQISLMSIRRYETGERLPTGDIARKIASILDVTSDDLIDPAEAMGIITEQMEETSNAIGSAAIEIMRNTVENSSKDIENWRRNAMNFAFDSMNEKGQKKAVENVQDLAKIPEYQRQTPENAGEDPNTPSGKDATQGK